MQELAVSQPGISRVPSDILIVGIILITRRLFTADMQFLEKISCKLPITTMCLPGHIARVHPL